MDDQGPEVGATLAHEMIIRLRDNTDIQRELLEEIRGLRQDVHALGQAMAIVVDEINDNTVATDELSTRIDLFGNLGHVLQRFVGSKLNPPARRP